MEDSIAERAQKLRAGPLSYISAFLVALQSLYDETSNPEGYVACVVRMDSLPALILTS